LGQGGEWSPFIDFLSDSRSWPQEPPHDIGAVATSNGMSKLFNSVYSETITLPPNKLTSIDALMPAIDQEQLTQDIEQKLTMPQVDIDEKLYTKHEVTQTPTIKINGMAIEDPFDYEKIKEMIDQELEANRNE